MKEEGEEGVKEEGEEGVKEVWFFCAMFCKRESNVNQT